MFELNFEIDSKYSHHECDSVIKGEWVIFRCPICKNYERRINMLTGETKVKNLSSIVRHSGRHMPAQFATLSPIQN
jgi:hypothetical protein